MQNGPQTVLVTGGAKRLGRAIALDLAASGFDIALHYNTSETDAADLAAQITTLGRSTALLKADLSCEEQVRDLIGRATRALGPIGALINSASLFEEDDWNSATRQSWDQHMAVNLRAPFVLAQEFARALPQNLAGAIINIIDQRVLKPTPQFLTYSLSKAGLDWLTVTLAQALAPRIRVNAVGPGPTLRNQRQSEADFLRQRAATLLGTGAEPRDVCTAVRYLLAAPAVTGQLIAVDGGQHLAWQTADVAVRE